MEELGIARGSYIVKVNNRKVLDGVMDAIGIGGEENAGRRLTVLRAIDKLDKFSEADVQLLLTTGRKDQSGDFTKGAGLADESAARLLRELKRDGSSRQGLGATHQAGIDELEAISQLVTASGYGEDRIRIDPSVVRGLEYYTGPVFEVELTFPIEGDDGKPVRFGSVAGGGRYDGLVGRFRSDQVPATGISIGVSRLMAALQHLNKVDTQPPAGPVVVTVFDSDRVADYQKMAAALRDAGIRAELYLGSGKFGAQMKYADKRGSPCAVIQGGDEKAKGEVQIKDLIMGAAITSIKEREEYLRKQAEAQFAVPEDQLVAAVRKVLARHGVNWE
jgi:histidyl-tRNA synthetase